MYSFALSFYSRFFQLTVAHTQISRQILIMTLRKHWREREGWGCAFYAVWQACDIFSPAFVSSIRAHAAYQHAGAHNKLHVVLLQQI